MTLYVCECGVCERGEVGKERAGERKERRGERERVVVGGGGEK